jgi:hypothetical protein
MELNIDNLIRIFQKNLSKEKEEFIEQDATGGGPPPSAGGGTTGTAGGYPSVPKWEDLYQIKVGKANPRNKKGTKWETGATRGVANQIW